MAYALGAISLIWRRYDGRQAVLYLLEGELASHNCKDERKNDPEREFGDAARQVAAEEDTRQGTHQQRGEYVPIDRAQHPVRARRRASRVLHGRCRSRQSSPWPERGGRARS